MDLFQAQQSTAAKGDGQNNAGKVFDKDAFLREAKLVTDGYEYFYPSCMNGLRHLANAYREDDKYGSGQDDFYAKWRIFVRNCAEAGLAFHQLSEAFHHMLKGDAREYEVMHSEIKKLALPDRAAHIAEYFSSSK